MCAIKSIYSVVKTPLVTEKTTFLSPYRKYAFWVSKDANKVEIKRAIEKIYNVKIEHVASAIIKGKIKRVRWNQPGTTSSWKKAIVTLKKGFEIKLT
jgi:large subunit ribosomal protein L23